MSRTSRRAALGAILAAPLASVPAAAADPHVAREATARALYQRHRETEWGWSTPNHSPADEAACEAHAAVMEFASDACDMPVPTTLAGLGALALAIALSEEQAYNERTPMDQDERMFVALVQAVLSVAGVTMPANYRGAIYRPREDDACA
ncbi:MULTISPECIES: hypothetical protein [Methylobacterium]|uniref:hypothetical protein n=1 Tax=Methylobacterium TaxID=407 RepID=UPI002F3583AB